MRGGLNKMDGWLGEWMVWGRNPEKERGRKEGTEGKVRWKILEEKGQRNDQKLKERKRKRGKNSLRGWMGTVASMKEKNRTEENKQKKAVVGKRQKEMEEKRKVASRNASRWYNVLLKYSFVSWQRLSGATLLVFANKQDLPGSLTADEIKQVQLNYTPNLTY